jgi:nickel superoxide dismutase
MITVGTPTLTSREVTMRTRIMFLSVMLITALCSRGALAHCEVPCGIYGDETRITLLREHIDTVERSMKMIAELSAADEINYNQLIRWTTNKDAHAEEIQHIVWQYFMTQRIKPAAEGSAHETYVLKLTILHHLLIEAMKSKQTLDHAHIEKMRSLVDEFEMLYFKKE